MQVAAAVNNKIEVHKKTMKEFLEISFYTFLVPFYDLA